jgi:hypothetical protein
MFAVRNDRPTLHRRDERDQQSFDHTNESSMKSLPIGRRPNTFISGVKTEGMSNETIDRKVITRAEREARKAFRQVEAEKAMTEHEVAEKAFYDNRDRLRAERLAREAAEAMAKGK